MLFCVISRLICRVSTPFYYTCHHWYSLRMLFLFYLFKVILKLRILQIFFVFLTILEIFIGTFIFSAFECKQKWTFCGTLHRNTRVSIYTNHFKNRINGKIGRLRNNYFLYFNFDFLFFNIFGISRLHIS